MNKTEAQYAKILAARKRLDEIVEWKYEPISLRLAPNCFYRPDFMVVSQEAVEFHEVKGGFIRDDALVKFKIAAEMYPWFIFEMWQYKSKQWTKIR